jgi:hypothetical protein
LLLRAVQDAPPRRTSLTAASAGSPAAHKRQAEPAHAQPAKRPAAGQQQLAVANQLDATPPLFLPSLTLAQLANVLHASYGYSSATSSWMLAPLRSLARQLHGKATDKNVHVSDLLPHVLVLLEQWSHPSIAPATALGYCTQVAKLLALPEVSRLLSQPALQHLTQELATARDRFDAANQAADSRAHANRPIKAVSTPMPAAAAAAPVAPPMGFQPAPGLAAAPAAAAGGDMLVQLTALLQQQAPTGVPASLLPQLRMLATQLLGPTYNISTAPLLPAMTAQRRTQDRSAANGGVEASAPEFHMARRLPRPAGAFGAGIGARGHASSADAGSEAGAAATDSVGGVSPDEAIQQHDSEEEAAAGLLKLADGAAAVAAAACDTIDGLC